MTQSYIIVLGNEKGGTGKSTVCMHIIMHLLSQGFSVGSIDVDARQGTLTRYVGNRISYIKKHNLKIQFPQHKDVPKSLIDSFEDARQDEEHRFSNALNELRGNDFIVIDTPGNDTFLSRLAHSYADTIITPLNDSFIDLDMLVRVTDGNLLPSVYSEMVWEQRKARMMRDKKSIDWIVMRNRLANFHSHNRQEVENVLSALSKRIGFRVAMGFNERVIFKELFVSGLTLLDLEVIGRELTISHITARQELRTLVDMIKIPFPKK